MDAVRLTRSVPFQAAIGRIFHNQADAFGTRHTVEHDDAEPLVLGDVHGDLRRPLILPRRRVPAVRLHATDMIDKRFVHAMHEGRLSCLTQVPDIEPVPEIKRP